MLGAIVFDSHFARDYGMAEAVLFQHILYWCEFNKANNKNFHKGSYWTFNKASAFSIQFPFLTERQVRYTLAKLEEKKLIKSGNFNKVKYDQTKWYTVTEKGVEEMARCIEEEKQLMSKDVNRNDKSANSNLQNCKSQSTNLSDLYQINTHNKPNLNSSDNNASESFTDVQDSEDAGACTTAEPQTPPSKADCQALPHTEDSPDNKDSPDITLSKTETPDDIKNSDISRSSDCSPAYTETLDIFRKQEETTPSVSDLKSSEVRQAASEGASPLDFKSLETHSAAGGGFPFAEEPKKARKASPKRKSARKTLTDGELDAYFAPLDPETVRRMHEITETLYKKARIADPLYVRSGNYLRNQTKKLTDFMASSGRTADEVEATFNFGFTDSFWCNVVVSVDVFLRNYTKILQKMRERGGRSIQKPRHTSMVDAMQIGRNDYTEDF